MPPASVCGGGQWAALVELLPLLLLVDVLCVAPAHPLPAHTTPCCCSGGSLATWLYGPPGARRAPHRSLSERLKMATDVARGMQALEEHTPQILHRDLKPSNVFIDATGTAKIADFGLARILTPAAMVSLTGETGSYLWM